MKTRLSLFLLIVLAFSLFLPSSTAMAKSLAEGKVIFGGTYRLESGETLDGDLVIFGAVATLEEGSVVSGGVILFGANLDASGRINGDVVGMGGLITLNESAKIDGDVLTLGSHLDKSNDARIMGDVTDITKAPFSFSFPREVGVPQSNIDLSSEFNLVWYILKTFLWAALAILVVLFVPNASDRVSHALVQQPLIAGGLGLLTVVLAIPLATIFIITIILSPLGLFVLLILGLCWGFGLIAIGLEIGKRFGKLINRDWADPILAAIGMFFLMLILGGVDAMIPCIGWMIPTAIGIVGLGAVLMTRFGTQIYQVAPSSYSYPPKAPAMPVVPVPPVPPAPPSVPQQIIEPEQTLETPPEENQSEDADESNPA